MTNREPDLNEHILTLEMEIHQLKKELRERQFEQFTLSKIQQMAKVGTWRLNHLTYEVCLSQELCSMLNHDAQNCKLKWHDFINLIDPQQSLNLDTRLIHLNHCVQSPIIHTLQTHSSQTLHSKHYSHTFTNSIGQPLRTVGLIQDITEEFKQAETLHIKATTDELTALYNRRKINDTLRQLIELSKQTKKPFSVVLFDLDKFKNVNDTYGHTYGDEILTSTADIMRRLLPKYAQYGRWGGEEFLILINNTSLSDACNIAQLVQQGLNKIAFPDKKYLSASFGVTQFKLDDNFTNLLTRVDQLMYEAKQSGRNSVVCG